MGRGLAITAVATTLILGACGGDDDTASVTTGEAPVAATTEAAATTAAPTTAAPTTAAPPITQPPPTTGDPETVRIDTVFDQNRDEVCDIFRDAMDLVGEDEALDMTIGAFEGASPEERLPLRVKAHIKDRLLTEC